MAAAMLRALLTLAVLTFAGEAEALRCGGRVVALGDHDFQVRHRCGEPYWIDQYAELRVHGAGGPFERRSERVFDDWYFNFGPNRLVQRLRFRDGRLVKIETLGYGRHGISERCEDVDLSPGTTLGEVALRCGPPTSRTSRYRDVVVHDRHGHRIRPVRHEEWLYARPGSRFARLAIFIDGRLDRVERPAL